MSNESPITQSGGDARETANSGIVEKAGYKQELKRALTLKDLILFGLLTVLPIAPVQVYPSIAQGTGGMVPLVYITGVVVLMFTVLSYRLLSQEFPYTGASYNFVARAVNPHLGFIAGWLITIDYLIAPSALIAFGASWLTNLTNTPFMLWIVLEVIFITFVNVKGITTTAKTDYIMLALEMLCVFAFIFLGIKYVFLDGGGVGHNTMEFIWQPGKIDFSFILGAITIALFGFLGFDNITTLAEEVENPRKTVGQGIVWTLLIIGLVFFAQAYIASLAHPNWKDLDATMGFFDIARQIGGDGLYWLWVVVAIVGVGIANALVVQTAVARLLYAMGRDNCIPLSGFFSKIHPKFQTPVNATLFVAVIITCLAPLGIGLLMTLVCLGALLTFILINASVFIWFWGKKKDRGGIQAVKYILFPAIGTFFVILVLLSFDKTAYIVGAVWLASGIVLGYIKSNGYKKIPESMKIDYKDESNV